MTSGGAVNISQEQLQQVAERLGERHLKCTHDGEWESHYPEGDGWQTRWRSDGDLLLSILNRAAEMGYETSVTFNPAVFEGDPKFWSADNVTWPRQYHGETVSSARGDSALEAAILAFIQLPIPASQGDA